MSKTPYDDLINLALDLKDFEWVKQLIKEKQSFLHSASTNASEFTNKCVAIEDITSNYAVLEPLGLRNLRWDNYDLMYSSLVMISKKSALANEIVGYRILSDEERLVLYGFYLGHDDGYKKGYIEGSMKTYQSLTPKPTNTNEVKTDIKIKKKSWWKFWMKD